MVYRESIEWCDIWIADGDGTDLPRVLLMGDSITRAYYDGVAGKLKGLASVSRLTTSKSVGDPALLKEIELVLPQHRWAAVHFNNGLHGWGYSEDDYGKAYPLFVSAIREFAPAAKLVCATTTPMYGGPELTELDARTERVIARNVIARNVIATGVASGLGIALDDLFALMHGHAEYFTPDGVHFNAMGVALQTERVAACLASSLPES